MEMWCVMMWQSVHRSVMHHASVIVTTTMQCTTPGIATAQSCHMEELGVLGGTHKGTPGTATNSQCAPGTCVLWVILLLFTHLCGVLDQHAADEVLRPLTECRLLRELEVHAHNPVVCMHATYGVSHVTHGKRHAADGNTHGTQRAVLCALGGGWGRAGRCLGFESRPQVACMCEYQLHLLLVNRAGKRPL